MFVYMTENG